MEEFASRAKSCDEENERGRGEGQELEREEKQEEGARAGADRSDLSSCKMDEDARGGGGEGGGGQAVVGQFGCAGGVERDALAAVLEG